MAPSQKVRRLLAGVDDSSVDSSNAKESPQLFFPSWPLSSRLLSVAQRAVVLLELSPSSYLMLAVYRRVVSESSGGGGGSRPLHACRYFGLRNERRSWLPLVGFGGLEVVGTNTGSSLPWDNSVALNRAKRKRAFLRACEEDWAGSVVGTKSRMTLGARPTTSGWLSGRDPCC